MPSVFGAAAIPFTGCVALLAAEVLTILAFASPYWASVGQESFGLWRVARCDPGSTGPDRQDCKRWDMLWSGAGHCTAMSCAGEGGEWWTIQCNCLPINHCYCRVLTAISGRHSHYCHLLHGYLCGQVTEKAWRTGKWYHWQHATRGLESLAIIFFAIPLIVLPVYIYVALGLYYRCTLALMTLFTFLGTLCNIAGVVIYGIKIGSNDAWKMDWCLIVCIIGGALGLIAAIILLISTINKPHFQPERYFSSGFYVDQDKNRLYVVETTDEPVKVIYAPSEPPTSARPPPTPLETGQINPALVPDD